MIGMNMTGQVELTKSEVLYFEKMTDNYCDELSKSQNDGVWIISTISHRQSLHTNCSSCLITYVILILVLRSSLIFPLIS